MDEQSKKSSNVIFNPFRKKLFRGSLMLQNFKGVAMRVDRLFNCCYEREI
jgi:hypothetical protein